MSIAIIDYGVGNLRSISNSFTHVASHLGFDVEILDRTEDLTRWKAIVLPGQGAFGSSIETLRQNDWVSPILEAVAAEVPLFGICVGMQLLLDSSEEMGQHAGLGLVPGHVERFPESTLDPLERDRFLRVPQIGWNQLEFKKEDPLLADLPNQAYAYFAHSFRCMTEDENVILATTDYGGPYTSILRSGNIWGIQCHPEKSQHVGLTILRNFMQMVENQGMSERIQPISGQEQIS